MLDKYQYSWRGVWEGVEKFSNFTKWQASSNGCAQGLAACGRGGCLAERGCAEAFLQHGDARGDASLPWEETSQTHPGSYDLIWNLKTYFLRHLQPRVGCSYPLCPYGVLRGGPWGSGGKLQPELLALQAAVLHISPCCLSALFLSSWISS